MDSSSLKAIIKKELTQTTPLRSLELQNHLYGCFIVMEDLAQHEATLEENYLVSSNSRFSLVNHFHQIGSYYGFIQDPHLELHSVSSEYRDQWMTIFREIYKSSSLDQVDTIEDAVISILQEVVPPAYDFFTQASSSGSLPQEWVMKALSLLHPTLFPKTDNATTSVSPSVTAEPSVTVESSVTAEPLATVAPTEDEKEMTPNPSSSVLSKANPENKMHPGPHHHYAKKKVRFEHTRRSNHKEVQPSVRKGFSKTRRQLTGM